MSEKGKLIVSTKSDAIGRKVFAVVIGVIFFFCAILFIGTGAVGEMLEEAERTYDEFEAALTVGIAIAVPIGSFMLSVAIPLAVFAACKSHCEVYECAVVGVTSAEQKTPSQRFEISYDEIMNVTESGKAIQIYTKYTMYKVRALNNGSTAVSEIRSRMKGA